MDKGIIVHASVALSRHDVVARDFEDLNEIVKQRVEGLKREVAVRAFEEIFSRGEAVTVKTEMQVRNDKSRDIITITIGCTINS